MSTVAPARTALPLGAARDTDAAYLTAIGERVREIRARRGMSRRTLAQDSGVSERYLASLESGRGNVSILLLKQIAQAIDVPVERLTRNGPEAPTEVALLMQWLSRLSAPEIRRASETLHRAFGAGGQERKRRVALIGLRGAGKTTLGKRLAARRRVPFIELDREIEQAAGASLAELFLLYGLPAYRRHERRALEALLLRDEAMVIATGGSIVSEPETFDLLLSTCRVVWLKAKPEEHMARVVAQGDQRPMAGSTEAMEDLKRILAGRELLYRKADTIVDTSGKSIAQSLKLLEQAAGAPAAKRARMNPMVTFDTDPDHYAHWRMKIDGAVATLVLDVDEDRGLKPGYKLKLNSYDLGVDIELADALQRLRFEHPEVHCLVITSGKERMFCSGANIYMLGASSHAWKVNFCKFTNETRNGIEDASLYSGLKSIAALNGTTAGGGYELALACDEILMIDDRSSTVSLPEVALLAVLPGTGGLTRLTDKRKLRRDLADVFCTTIEGVRADRAKAWGLVDAIATPSMFAETLARRAKELAAAGAHDTEAGSPRGIVLTPLERTLDETSIKYPNLEVALDRTARVATFTLHAPANPTPDSIEAITALGADWWPLSLARELDDAMLLLRTNELDIGTWVMRTAGDLAAVLAVDATLATHAGHWLVRETVGLWRRTLSRLDVSARSVFALIDRGSCFAGTLLELALAADRSYMLALPDERAAEPAIALSMQNFGAYPMCNGRTRLANRFAVDALAPDRIGTMLRSDAAREAGLVTFTPDDLDWDGEIRLALEERASLSPDALSGMEASLRFSGPETMHARIFGRLAAWQNWVFQRPNAVGKDGALKLFGSGTRAKFDWERV